GAAVDPVPVTSVPVTSVPTRSGRGSVRESRTPTASDRSVDRSVVPGSDGSVLSVANGKSQTAKSLSKSARARPAAKTPGWPWGLGKKRKGGPTRAFPCEVVNQRPATDLTRTRAQRPAPRTDEGPRTDTRPLADGRAMTPAPTRTDAGRPLAGQDSLKYSGLRPVSRVGME